MTWFGTDLVALGCILGGAAVGGTVTAAMINGGEHADTRCAVEAFGVSPTITISHRGEARAIVVTPDVRVRGMPNCVQGLDGRMEIELRQLERRMEAEVGQQMEARLQFEDAMRQMKEAQVNVVVKRAEGGGS
ncbi:MAG: hypothetical protein MUO50_07485 [Longimicrobiales bacterium]|nr:hypothetical protein [Longimicrobiales bacterium]